MVGSVAVEDMLCCHLRLPEPNICMYIRHLRALTPYVIWFILVPTFGLDPLRFKSSGVAVNDQTRELATLVDELETVKTNMDERGNSMTDSAPLVKIKQALIGMKSEISEMELRAGVLQHTLMAAKVRGQKQTVHDMNRNPAVSAGWH